MNYEYKVIKPSSDRLEEALNEYSDGGWSLVGFWENRYRDTEHLELVYVTAVLQRERHAGE